MGGTGWDYVTKWRGDIDATFAALQQEVFESRSLNRSGFDPGSISL